ncbi:MAG: SUMF1/EgtB/PvdO family nonheme iron enzyme [Byssovorax sp.]
MLALLPRHLGLSLGVLALLGAVIAACASSHAETLPEPSTSATTAALSAPPPAASAAPPPSTSASASGSIAAPSATSATSAITASSIPDGGADAGPETVQACPSEMVEIGRYCVDRYEGHLVTVGSDGAINALPHYLHPDVSVRFEARSEPDFFPQGYISRNEATLACKNAGKRLCSRAEWSRACRGSKGFHYPYGARVKAGACNSGKGHLLTRFFGPDARAWKYEESFNNPKLDQEPGFLAKTGEYGDCQAAGVFDMVGNLHEWVSDTVDEDIEELLERDQVTRRSQPHRPGNGIFMGGFFSTTDELGPGCTYVTIAHEPSYHDYSTGFRCCKDSAIKPAPKAGKKTRK